MMLFVLLIGCPNNPTNKMSALEEMRVVSDCINDDDLPSCYKLRNSESLSTRKMGLSFCCMENYKDSCRQYYYLDRQKGDIMLFVFDAAVTACTGNHDLEMCTEALNFAKKHPDFSADSVELFRPRLEAVLEGRPIPPYSRQPSKDASGGAE